MHQLSKRLKDVPNALSPIVRPSIQPFRKSRISFVKRLTDYIIGLMTVVFLRTTTWLNGNCVRWLSPERSASVLNPTPVPELARFL